jgi:transcription initiation factor TFIID subunit 13
MRCGYFMMTRETVAYMMYGFGDAKEPDPDSIALMEDMLVEYLTNVAHRSMEVAERRGRMQTEDLLYVIRNDRKKFARVDELLEMNAKLKDARRNFELNDPASVLAQERAAAEAERAKQAQAQADEAEGDDA